MQIQSALTCPHCGHVSVETMPADACQFFYDCKGCGKQLKPKAGDCCVFCSYGSVPCPPVQQNGKCGPARPAPSAGTNGAESSFLQICESSVMATGPGGGCVQSQRQFRKQGIP